MSSEARYLPLGGARVKYQPPGSVRMDKQPPGGVIGTIYTLTPSHPTFLLTYPLVASDPPKIFISITCDGELYPGEHSVSFFSPLSMVASKKFYIKFLIFYLCTFQA